MSGNSSKKRGPYEKSRPHGTPTSTREPGNTLRNNATPFGSLTQDSLGRPPTSPHGVATPSVTLAGTQPHVGSPFSFNTPCSSPGSEPSPTHGLVTSMLTPSSTQGAVIFGLSTPGSTKSGPPTPTQGVAPSSLTLAGTQPRQGGSLFSFNFPGSSSGSQAPSPQVLVTSKVTPSSTQQGAFSFGLNPQGTVMSRPATPPQGVTPSSLTVAGTQPQQGGSPFSFNFPSCSIGSQQPPPQGLVTSSSLTIPGTQPQGGSPFSLNFPGSSISNQPPTTQGSVTSKWTPSSTKQGAVSFGHNLQGTWMSRPPTPPQGVASSSLTLAGTQPTGGSPFSFNSSGSQPPPAQGVAAAQGDASKWTHRTAYSTPSRFGAGGGPASQTSSAASDEREGRWRDRRGLNRSIYRVTVKNLAASVDFKQLKRFFQEKVGSKNVAYADAHTPIQNEGFVEFNTYDSMMEALVYNGCPLGDGVLNLIRDTTSLGNPVLAAGVNFGQDANLGLSTKLQHVWTNPDGNCFGRTSMILVASIPRNVTIDQLVEHFKGIKLTSIRLIMKDDSINRGYGYLSFIDDAEIASKAIAMYKLKLDGAPRKFCSLSLNVVSANCVLLVTPIPVTSNDADLSRRFKHLAGCDSAVGNLPETKVGGHKNDGSCLILFRTAEGAAKGGTSISDDGKKTVKWADPNEEKSCYASSNSSSLASGTRKMGFHDK